jgi:hypothetical protein
VLANVPMFRPSEGYSANDPTQAKTGVEWATRVEWGTVDAEYTQRLPTSHRKAVRSQLNVIDVTDCAVSGD